MVFQAIDPNQIEPPDLTGAGSTTGVKKGVTGGSTTVPGGLPSVPGSPAASAQPTSPQSLLNQRWTPPSMLNWHKRLAEQPADASRDLDTAIQRAYTNSYTLEKLIACTQVGSVTVTGKSLAIPTGLKTVKTCSGSVDNGSTAHNFWVTVTPSQTPGAIDVYVWQPTSSGNNTPIAGTTPVAVNWTARGSL